MMMVQDDLKYYVDRAEDSAQTGMSAGMAAPVFAVLAVVKALQAVEQRLDELIELERERLTITIKELENGRSRESGDHAS